MPLALSPASALVIPNGRVKLTASGGTPPYTFAVSQNLSGGSVDSTGLYLAGPHGLVIDTVTVTDSVAATASSTVQVTAGLWQKTQQNLGPPSTKLPNAQVVEGEFGAEKDVEGERARQGLVAGIPGLGPTDVLPYVGSERQILRAGSDTDATYAEALRTAWDAHGRNTSHRRILEALDRAGFPMGDPSGAHVMQRYKRYSWLTASGGSVVYGTHPVWTFDATVPDWMWNQFGIIFGADVPGLSAGTDMAQLLNETVDLVQPAKGNFMGTWIIVSGPTWGWPVGTVWGQLGLTWGGGVTRYVPPL